MIGSLAGPSLGSHAALRRQLRTWLHAARDAGLEPEDIEALFDTTMHAVESEEIA